jgi:Capsule polysaccharide biosynthesis protein
MPAKTSLKNAVAGSPLAMEAYWLFNPAGHKGLGRYNLHRLTDALPAAVQQARPFAARATRGKDVFIFATLHYWIEQAAFIGVTLAGLGHRVTLAYLPYGDWRKEVTPFDLRRHVLYTRDHLKPAEGLIKIVNLLDVTHDELLSSLQADIRLVAEYDTMYTDQVEEVDTASAIYQLRLARDLSAAAAASSYLKQHRPEVALIPNGTILELGAVYRVAKHLDIPVTTYEFNDQREQIWITQNDEIMRQNTDQLWADLGSRPLTEVQSERIREFESARMGARLEGKAARLWQDIPAQGGDSIRAQLGLDARPVVLLATNVLGDSLTLGRNVFSKSMAEWITRTVQYFASRKDAQLVIRVHPGERLTHGPSMVDVVKAAVPALPENIHIVGPLEKANTYDLMELTSLGLVFTTTTGLEMSLNGIPVIACGNTHYRNRGFTLDPKSYDEYFSTLNNVLDNVDKCQLSETQVELAWRYAYYFFFDYPRPFPWRLISFWEDIKVWPVGRALSEEGESEFGRTFGQMLGDPLSWKS